MSSITLLGDTSGSIVIDAPAIAGSNTITLPTTGGTIRTTRTPGTILQVVQAVSNAPISINSTSMTDTGYAVSITPSSTSSRILVMMSISEMRVRGDVGANIAIYRNGSEVIRVGQEVSYSAGGGGTQNTGTIGMMISYQWVDSPSSTSSLQYRVYARKLLGNAGTLDFLVNTNGGTATMIAMEIAG